MNKAQKIAWFNLIVVMVFIIGGLVCLVSGIRNELFYSVWFLFNFGLIVLSPLLFRGKTGQICFDERDYLIRAQAWLVAVSASYGSLGGSGIYYYFKIGAGGSIPMETLLGLFISALITLVIAKSLATLIFYAKGFKHGKW